MEKKTYTQYGTNSVVVMLLLFIVSAFLSIVFGLAENALVEPFIFFSFTFLILPLIFYKLTITVDNTKVSFKLGVGIISKSYRISDLKACIPVKNSFFDGGGVRFISNGMLYSVSGNKAIELHFNTMKYIVRIGTDRPEEICEFIKTKISLSQRR
jgi:hypothetical protein